LQENKKVDRSSFGGVRISRERVLLACGRSSSQDYKGWPSIIADSATRFRCLPTSILYLVKYDLGAVKQDVISTSTKQRPALLCRNLRPTHMTGHNMEGKAREQVAVIVTTKRIVPRSRKTS
jgi:hypothetical protein